MNSSHYLLAVILIVAVCAGGAVFYVGFRTGTSVAVDQRITALLERALDPGPRVGALPSQLAELEAEPPVDVDPPTNPSMPAARPVSSRPRHARRDGEPVWTPPEGALIAAEDSYPGQRMRTMFTAEPEWPGEETAHEVLKEPAYRSGGAS